MALVMAYVTCKDEKEAAEIAKKLVKEKLAACANIIPKIRSLYFWKGEMQDHAETLLIMKTTKPQMHKLEKRVLQLHSSEVPCVCFYKALAANEDYTKWVGGPAGTTGESGGVV